MGVAASLVIEIAAGHLRVRVVADGQPGLREMALLDVIGGARTAHPRRHPSRGERIRQHIGPAPGDAKRQQHVMQLAVRVGLAAVPPSVGPLRVVQVRAAAGVHAGTEIDQPAGPAHQRGQHVRRQHVDRPKLAQAVLGLDAVRLAVADANIVDHRVEASAPVCLIGDVAHGGNGRKIAGENGRGLRQRGSGCVGPRRVAGMQGDRVALFGQQAPRHQAEPVGRSGDEDFCHGVYRRGSVSPARVGLLRRLALHPIGKRLAEFHNFRRHHHLAIAAPGVAGEVVVVFGFGLVEYGQRFDLRDQLAGIQFRVGDLLDDGPSGFGLGVGVGEDDRAVLRPDIVALAVLCGWVVDGEEHAQQVSVGQFVRVELDLHDLGMAGAAGADRLVAGVRHMAGGIAGHHPTHAPQFLEDCF